MNDKLFTNFYNRWEEVTMLPTQSLGPLTPVYKRVIPLFKNAPWRIIIPAAFVVVTLGALFIDVTAAQIASLLQRAF